MKVFYKEVLDAEKKRGEILDELYRIEKMLKDNQPGSCIECGVSVPSGFLYCSDWCKKMDR